MNKKHFLYTSIAISAILSSNVAYAEEVSLPASKPENELIIDDNTVEETPKLASSRDEGSVAEGSSGDSSSFVMSEEVSVMASAGESAGIATRTVAEATSDVTSVMASAGESAGILTRTVTEVASGVTGVITSTSESAGIATRAAAEVNTSVTGAIDKGLREETTQKGKADFVFVIDTTGSMNSYINKVERNLSSFVEYLEESGIDYQVSVVSFGDSTEDEKPKNFPPVHKSHPNAVEEIRNQLRTIGSNKGGDDPETPTVPLYYLGENGHDKEDGELVHDLMLTYRGWRDKYPYRDAAAYAGEGREPVHKLVFLLTDADYKEEGKYLPKENSEKRPLPVMAEVINQFQLAGIKTTVVSRGSLKDRYAPLYTHTGGKFIDIDASDYGEVLKETAKWVVDSVKFSDRDRDGLLDVWEEEGIDVDGDGKYDLPALSTIGANPDKKDLFIEVDTMANVKKRLTEKEYRYLYEQFKRHGIQLHIDAGPDSKNFVLDKKWSELPGGSSGGEIETARVYVEDNYLDWHNVLLKNFSVNRMPIFRHALILGEKFNKNGSGGLASNLPGSAFLVWADGHRNLDSVMSTFMHEFGHTLGLYHGGDEHTNYKPNYLSIMNYLYSTAGLMTYSNRNEDKYNFSEYELPELNEKHLNEKKGIDPENVTGDRFYAIKWMNNKEKVVTPDLVSGWERFWNGFSGKQPGIGAREVDWNQNGKSEDDVSVDILYKDDSTKEYYNKEGIIKKSINDWNRLVFKGGLVGAFGASFDDLEKELADGFGKEELKELSVDDFIEMGLMGNPGDITVEPLPAVLKAGSDNTLSLKVVNLYPQDTTFKLMLTSDQWSEPLVYDLEAKGQVGELTETIIKLPLSVLLKEGELNLSYRIQKQNAGELELTQSLVVEAQPIANLPQPAPQDDTNRDRQGDDGLSTERNLLLLEVDGSPLSDSQKSSLAETIAFSETRDELAKARIEFERLRASLTKMTVEEKTSISENISSAPVVKSNGLPATGENSSLPLAATGIGLLLASLGLAYYRKHQ